MKPTLIIDADDTLWETQIYYEQCIADFGELMAELGFGREEAERAVAMVGASGERLVELANWGVDGGHLFFYNRVTLAPQGSHDLVAYLALTGSLEEAKRYEVMKRLAMTNGQ